MPIDVLSDVLRAVQLTGAVFFDFEMRAPWVAEAPPAREIASRVMPGAPADPWTVELLARRAGLSRSMLADRFAGLVGQPPMQYLALWRMQLASRRLLDGEAVASVAAGVGYHSEAAFSRTFKKLVGQSPAAWRAGGLGDARARRTGAAHTGEGSPPMAL